MLAIVGATRASDFGIAAGIYAEILENSSQTRQTFDGKQRLRFPPFSRRLFCSPQRCRSREVGDSSAGSRYDKRGPLRDTYPRIRIVLRHCTV